MMRGIHCAIIACCAFFASESVSQEFKPIRELTTWYTDRSPIDVEIVGTRMVSGEFKNLEPDRVLRFRLERAYVSSLTRRKVPGVAIISFGIDLETMLPLALFRATSNKGKFKENIAGIPVLEWKEINRRAVLIRFNSNDSDELAHSYSAQAARCRGEPDQGGLFKFVENGSSCRGASFYVTERYISDDATIIECREVAIGCRMTMAFEKFTATINFHREHLGAWRTIKETSQKFLQKVTYR